MLIVKGLTFDRTQSAPKGTVRSPQAQREKHQALRRVALPPQTIRLNPSHPECRTAPSETTPAHGSVSVVAVGRCRSVGESVDELASLLVVGRSRYWRSVGGW